MHRRRLLGALTTACLAGTASGTAAQASEDADDGQTAALEPLGSVELEGVRELTTNEDGTVAYAAVGDGVATLDVSDPAAPTVLAERRGLLPDADGGPVEKLWDVWPDGDRLLAVAQAHATRAEDVHGAFLFDVSDPAEPALLDVHPASHPIHNCHFDDATAYLTANREDGHELAILDAAGDALDPVGSWSPLDYDDAWAEVYPALWQLHDVSVRDDVAYLAHWDAGTWLVDVSDPAAPSYVGHTARYGPETLATVDGADYLAELDGPPGNSHFVQVDDDGDLLAVGRETWEVKVLKEPVGGPSGIDLYDVSDPTEIEHLATIEPPPAEGHTLDDRFATSHNFDLVDGRLYSSWYFGGLRVHDVSDPERPHEIAAWRDDDEAALWTARSAVPGEYLVASSFPGVEGVLPDVPGRVYVFPDVATDGLASDGGPCQNGDAATVDGRTVCDVDGDGLYRDVTGDGSVGQTDVVEFFEVQHRAAWKRPELFDFSGDGTVGHGDVIELFETVARR